MTSLLELRVLEGPNLYFPRAAIKLTLDVGSLSQAPERAVLRLGRRVGLRSRRAGDSGSELRGRYAGRLLGRLLRQVSQESGTTRLAVRVRATSDPAVVVAAYPWRNRARARALGEGVAAVLDAVAQDPGGDLEAAVAAAAQSVTEAPTGEKPTTLRPRVPVVAVTGTNGKTTTSRMVAHIAMAGGQHVGWSSTDGIYVDGVHVEQGDFSGPSGAGRVLAHPEVQVAVTETARGGILLKGIGLTHNDVSVVTNVTADHLGLHGIDTLDQLAEVKGVVPRITRRGGWCVLNAEDPRVYAMRSTIRGRLWIFCRDASAPMVRETLDAGGRVTTVVDEQITVLTSDGDADQLIDLADVPMTLAGLSRYNVENALAAASAALAVGIRRGAVVEGLGTFLPDIEHNPGRMNFFRLGETTVVMDLAHNEAGLEAMFEVLHGVRRDGGRVLLGLGVLGDRTDELVRALGEIGARHSDLMVIGHKQKYLRGRTTDELDEIARAGAADVGVEDVASYPTELTALQALLDQAAPGDVVGLMSHAERYDVRDWILEQGGAAMTAAEVKALVLAARG